MLSLLAREELVQLLRVLQEDARLEDVLMTFVRSFGRHDLFRVCLCLCVLLDAELLSRSQRACALFLLAELYRAHPSGVNPFLPVLLAAVGTDAPSARAAPVAGDSRASLSTGVAPHTLSHAHTHTHTGADASVGPGQSVRDAERHWAAQLLLAAAGNRELGKRTAREALQDIEAALALSRMPDLPDTTEFQRVYASLAPAAPAVRSMELSAVVCAPLLARSPTAGEGVPSDVAAGVVEVPNVWGLLPGVQPLDDSAGRAQRADAATSRILPASNVSSEARVPWRMPPRQHTLEELLAATETALQTLDGDEPPARPIARILTALLPSGPSSAIASGGVTAEPPTPVASICLPAITHVLIADVECAPAVAHPLTSPPPGDRSPPPPPRAASNPLVNPSLLFSLRGFAPTFCRIAPPVLDFEDAEYVPVLPIEPPPLLWDVTMAEDTTHQALVRDIMTRAMKAPLSAAQHDAVLAALDVDPKTLWTSGLAPCRLESIITSNPSLAIELLHRIRLFGPPTLFADYLSELVRMSLTLHSMEVVNQLTMLPGELPSEFLRLYISHCISSCESLTDKYMQNRLVRLVCVFLQSLIRNRMIHVGDLFVEVQAFCIEFSRIREAAGLFRVLKTL